MNTSIEEEHSNINGLFTLDSLLSLQGAAAAALLVPNVLAYLIGPGFQSYEKWVAFVIAMGLALWTAYRAPKKDSSKWLLAILNGFLIFASAIGVNQAAATASATSAPQPAQPPFFHNWF
jgi:hypothetical protein